MRTSLVLALLGVLGCSSSRDEALSLRNGGKDDGAGVSLHFDATHTFQRMSIRCDEPGGCDLTVKLTPDRLRVDHAYGTPDAEGFYKLAVVEIDGRLYRLLVDGSAEPNLFYQPGRTWSSFSGLVVPTDGQGRQSRTVTLEIPRIGQGTDLNVYVANGRVQAFDLSVWAEWHASGRALDGGGAYPIDGGGAYPIDGGGAYPIDGGGAYPIDFSSRPDGGI